MSEYTLAALVKIEADDHQEAVRTLQDTLRYDELGKVTDYEVTNVLWTDIENE